MVRPAQALPMVPHVKARFRVESATKRCTMRCSGLTATAYVAKKSKEKM